MAAPSLRAAETGAAALTALFFPPTSLSCNCFMADLSVTIGGVRLKNPVIAASGTFGYGAEYSSLVPVERLGGICSKGLTLEPRPGNSGIRLWEMPSGLMNSIGLENPGVRSFVANELKMMKRLGPAVIANLAGSDLESYAAAARILNKSDVDMVELNISCPNVKAGGMAWGMSPEAAKEAVSTARKELRDKPLMVKLTPNAPDIAKVAAAAIEGGADAISLANAFQAFAVDIESARPVFSNATAGLSGPSIKPIALRLLRDVATKVPECAPAGRVPLVGIGGIASWQDAVEFIMAGASAIQVGSAVFSNPAVYAEILSGLPAFMERKGYASIAAMRGAAL